MITIHHIGLIHSPYKTTKDIPIQSRFDESVEAYIELDKKYVEGLKDLDGFSHAYILFHFHKTDQEHLQGSPFLEDNVHGIFAIRSPHRPNHIGLSIVHINRIKENKLFFTGVDMLDGTPVIDIKPYVKQFDCRENAVSGWLEKHFKDDNSPDKTTIT